MNIGILGLGYVGIVNVACLSKQGYTVMCNDVKPQKVAAVRKGKSPINEPDVEGLIAQGVANGTVIPMDSASELIQKSDVIITCVGTPSQESGEVNLDYLRNVMREIASNVKTDEKKYLVCRSTVPPGTTEAVYNRYLSDTAIIPVFYPEFLREGSAVRDFYDYGRFVLGSRPKDNIDELVDILHVNKERPSFVTDLKTAEYSKYIDNSFHALKIVFANEVFSLGRELGVNIEDSHAIFTADDKLNVSKRYLRPGLPFGGSCLPKDLRELQFLISKSEQEFALLPSMIPSNDAFVNSLVRKVKDKGIQKIAFVGISFKNDSDDLRESPVLRVLRNLDRTGDYELKVWDEDLQLANLRIDHPRLFSMVESFEDCIGSSELLVVSKRFLPKVLAIREDKHSILNFSDTQFEAVSDIESLYQ
jgi:GDP-mannose 6-dehydrogenase